MSRVTGEEYRRQKELEEARKAGLAPAEVDEEGKEINPHIPQYMTNAPWYLNKDKPTLSHQRDWRSKGQDDTNQWYDRGAKVFQATKWRKGACENCGSMSHQTKDCLERPRSKGAKWTNKNIAADDKIDTINLASYDAKRDRWNGFDSQEYEKVINRYEQLEAMRKELKQKEQMEKLYGKKGEGAKVEDVDVDDEAKIHDDEQEGFGEVKKRVRTTAGGSTGSVRNLRIREDTAKYLLNLDMNSAHYDPKSRSMREDPNPEKPLNEKTFAGDNFVRHNGDYAAWQSLTLHSMEAVEKGLDVHMQANPSLAEVLHKQFREKKEQLAKGGKQEVLAKYGNVAEQKPEDVAALMGTERYVEYDRMGRVIKGQEVKVRSRYEEDVYFNNHTSVWGSWWKDGQWGYACCHQMIKNSYCTGKAGEAATQAVTEQMVANLEAKAAEKAAADQKKKEESKLNNHQYMADVWGEDVGDAELDEKKVREAMKKLAKQEAQAVDEDGNKRKYNSLNATSDNVTPEEMEAFRRTKLRADDPAANPQAGTAGYDLL